MKWGIPLPVAILKAAVFLKTKMPKLCPWEDTIFLSAVSGQTADLQAELDKGKKVDSRDLEYGRTALSWAAEQGHSDIVQLLLERGANADALDSIDGKTPIMHAASYGYEAVVRLLLEANASCEISEIFGRTPLTFAAKNGNAYVVEIILKAGADINVRERRSGESPLLQATKGGHENAVKFLLESGAEVDLGDQRNQTPLIWAAKKGYESAVKLLLESGAAVDVEDETERTPIEWAAIKGHEGIVRLLSEHLKTINADEFGWVPRPLACAVEGGRDVIAQYLMGIAPQEAWYDSAVSAAAITSQASDLLRTLLERREAEMRVKDSGVNDLLLSAATSGCEEQVKILLTQVTDPDLQDEDGRTVLSLAAENGLSDAVGVMLKLGTVNADLADECGRTPLSWAAEKGHAQVVRLLIEEDVDPDSTDKRGRTPLLYAIEAGHEAIVSLLLERPVDAGRVEEGEDYERSLLAVAAELGHRAIVEMLLAKNVRIEADYDHCTPLMLALDNGHENVLKLLVEHGADPYSDVYFDDSAPLTLAAERGLEETVALFLRQKATSEETKKDHAWTALGYASAEGHAGVVELLLEQYPSQEMEVFSACESAEMHGHEEIVRLLEQHSIE